MKRLTFEEMLENELNIEMLNTAHKHAESFSGCLKVKVGSAIWKKGADSIILGSNYSIPNCVKKGICARVEKYGDDSKDHRLPSDCNAIHSEVCAIANAAGSYSAPTFQATIWVTRYPCEACARAIVMAEISKVVYGRQQEISELTKKIFEEGSVKVVHCKEWDAEDTTR